MLFKDVIPGCEFYQGIARWVKKDELGAFGIFGNCLAFHPDEPVDDPKSAFFVLEVYAENRMALFGPFFDEAATLAHMTAGRDRGAVSTVLRASNKKV